MKAIVKQKAKWYTVLYLVSENKIHLTQDVVKHWNFAGPLSGSGDIREKHKFQNQLDVYFCYSLYLSFFSFFFRWTPRPRLHDQSRLHPTEFGSMELKKVCQIPDCQNVWQKYENDQICLKMSTSISVRKIISRRLQAWPPLRLVMHA